MKTRKEERKKIRRERVTREEGRKNSGETKGDTEKTSKNVLFLGGNRFFLSRNNKENKAKPQNKQNPKDGLGPSEVARKQNPPKNKKKRKTNPKKGGFKATSPDLKPSKNKQQINDNIKKHTLLTLVKRRV